MLLKIELEKLCRKPALWTGFLLSLLAGLYLIRIMMPVVYTGEEELRGTAAVRYNRSITAAKKRSKRCPGEWCGGWELPRPCSMIRKS